LGSLDGFIISNVIHSVITFRSPERMKWDTHSFIFRVC
jgi:hypothetical protein